MKILLVPHSYPPVLGGVQSVVHQLAQGLAARRHDVQVVTPQDPHSLPSGEMLDGIAVTRYAVPQKAGQTNGIRGLPVVRRSLRILALLRLGHLVREFQPESLRQGMDDR